MFGLSRLTLLLLVTSVVLLPLSSGCSRIGVAYNTGPFLVKNYARDYLSLDRAQVRRWEPVLEAELARHRSEELPYLAAYFDHLLKASEQGFDQHNTACLTAELRALYQRQARIAVNLAAPLLTDLSASQVQQLEQRFAKQAEEDRAKQAERTRENERLARTRRYVKSIEDWTGPLNAEQQFILADITDRMPNSQERLLDYRTHKRKQLIAMLRANASEPEIHAFLSAWLVTFSDLPQELEQSGEQITERISELVIRLGASLDPTQRQRLETRLRGIRDDLLKLQRQPRMAPLAC
ncbi:hypothetical protein CKO25_11995 [Thiocapsa imhoffii]|uniref:Lipoprotein n=1 Tax=Thiocapsa imhoffii TaxID=382777 RepID=A0A9X1B9R2_9GAMM|nr:DUF6279 family lipoprotein [Thiocapsa imhoffii]MBK1645350.1 hypothetical protein [Thiocapsa imhoffii]